MFLKSKTLPQRAEEERAKVQMKELQLRNQTLDRQMIAAKKKKAEELKRLTA